MTPVEHIIDQINDILLRQHLATHLMTTEDERVILKMAVDKFTEALQRGEIDDIPEVYLASNENGHAIVRV